MSVTEHPKLIAVFRLNNKEECIGLYTSKEAADLFSMTENALINCLDEFGWFETMEFRAEYDE